MNAYMYTIVEYLAWISLSFVVLITVLVCLTVARAVFLAAHALAVRWNAFMNRRHHHAVGRTS